MIKVVLLSLTLYANYGYAFKLLDENIVSLITSSLSKNINKSTSNVKDDSTTIPQEDTDVIAKNQYKDGPSSKEVTMNITELIQYNGFNVEKHQLESEDGYILNMFRIPGDGPVIFLMHGLTLSADDWVTPGRTSGLAYLFAEKGFDVWMGNARGCKHSRQHKTLSPENANFWDFSYYEIGVYDLPAMIDYVLDATKQSQLFFVGHSQGATSFFIMCSEKPEYNSKIKLMVGLGPTGAIPNAKTPFFKLAKVLTKNQPDLGFKALRLFGLHEFTLTEDICKNKILKVFCNSIVTIAAGQDHAQTNFTTLPIVHAHAPAGASTKQFEHYAQAFKSGKFSQFDYGKKKNMEKYGSETPPEFCMKNVVAPVAIFYGNHDQLAPIEDVFNLRDILPNVVITYKIPYENFGHLDFAYAKDLKVLVFAKLLELVEMYA